MQRFRGGLVFKAHTLCVSLNSRLESNKEEEARALQLLGGLDRAAQVNSVPIKVSKVNKKAPPPRRWPREHQRVSREEREDLLTTGVPC